MYEGEHDIYNNKILLSSVWANMRLYCFSPTRVVTHVPLLLISLHKSTQTQNFCILIVMNLFDAAIRCQY